MTEEEYNKYSYGDIQYCCKCKEPLEKARVLQPGKGVCRECQRKRGLEHNRKYRYGKKKIHTTS